MVHIAPPPSALNACVWLQLVAMEGDARQARRLSRQLADAQADMARLQTELKAAQRELQAAHSEAVHQPSLPQAPVQPPVQTELQAAHSEAAHQPSPPQAPTPPPVQTELKAAHSEAAHQPASPQALAPPPGPAAAESRVAQLEAQLSAQKQLLQEAGTQMERLQVRLCIGSRGSCMKLMPRRLHCGRHT